MSRTTDIMELWEMPKTYQYNSKEISEIKKHIPKKSFTVKYAIYNKHSPKNRYVVFIIDTMPGNRKSGIENFWTYVAEREITNAEYEEQIANFGSNNRRFIVWYYKSINHLILDDLKYNVKTPENFVKLCEEKGYTTGVQLILEI